MHISFSCDADFKQSNWIKNVSFDDVTITDNVIVSLSDVRTKVTCARECQQHRYCVSFSYNNDHTCRLHSVKFANASYLSSLGWRYYYSDPGDCPVEDGYMQIDSLNLCIKVSTDRKSFDEAREICRQSYARLIVLDTDEKHSAVSNYITAGPDVYYIGLSDVVTKGVFVWEDGETAVFTAWDDGEPNNAGGGEDCVLLTVTLWKSVWFDISCNAKYNYICEKQP
ncbi:perlucin-like [Gigantopelta aegis]|uniref:perlucin-like n=1 Tax=Gigantopelta aegis TaxID=1735272 RepID=UPI001B88CE2A|nr:perlucin-like [Gigantopelta aegis]